MKTQKEIADFINGMQRHELELAIQLIWDHDRMSPQGFAAAFGAQGPEKIREIAEDFEEFASELEDREEENEELEDE